ncbi:hypothetical protein [Mycetocola zhadangensis]|uniref:Uncharacterized protein n=1 Tax=Mycetocola zhadangensis TaxID=1164595 RepID=A0A3L7J7A7_9MICO|nr:hypothetical protein [Mycetocola zhadangensis]RLQ86430.1 hypothetical protein D9V28_06355 [Mycetocola zhadangensis]GGE91153.1 hypothetical protein GCM10011313_12550 [Mycetocola zhadangensis]
MSLTSAERLWIDRRGATPWALTWEWLARPAHYRAVRNLRLAAENSDTNRLASLLDPDVAVVVDGSDGGAQSIRVVAGRHDVTALLLYGVGQQEGRFAVERSVNGQAGLVLSQDGQTTAAVTVDFSGRLVSVVWVKLNSTTLRHWNTVWPGV